MVYYPAAPWRLYGWAALLVDWINLDQVRKELIPKPLLLDRLLRNDTLSGHYLASYRACQGCSFPKSFCEFAYIPSMVACQNENGFHIPQMAVNSESAIEGGKHIWGINKTHGDFEPVGHYGYHITNHETNLDVQLEFRKWIDCGYWQRNFPFLNLHGSSVIKYSVDYYGRVYLCRCRFSGLSPRGVKVALLFDDCWITINSPTAVTSAPSPVLNKPVELSP